MEADKSSQDNSQNESDVPSVDLKRVCLSNGPADQDLLELTAEIKPPLVVIPENGLACNGAVKIEDMRDLSDRKGSNEPESLVTAAQTAHVDGPANCTKGKMSVKLKGKSSPTKDASGIVSDTSPHDKTVCGDDDCCMDTDEDQTSDCANSTANKKNISSQNHTTESELGAEKVNSPHAELTGFIKSADNTDCDTIEDVDVKSLGEVKEATESGDEVLIQEEGTTDNFVKCSNVDFKLSVKDAKHTVKGTSKEVKSGASKDEDVKVDNKYKINISKNGLGVQNNEQPADSSTDDIEIIGESRVVTANKLKRSSRISPHVSVAPVSHGLTVTGGSSLLVHSSPSIRSIISSPASSQGFIPNRGPTALTPALAGTGAAPGHSPHNIQLFVPPVAPPKPKSSLDQIELIRWEIQNRISTRPKYFKPCPSSELGPLAKFLFDIGSDLIKEGVYHDLVKIQSKKNNNDKLSDKEKQDLGKLKQIEKDLFATIGHLKLKLKKRCKVCHFHTESDNVMFYHKQYPHEDNKCMRCSHCSFVTKQAMAFKFHMESGHGVHAKFYDKKAFHECDLCPYENNQEQKLTLHKQRCIKQFRPLFNLHPSCLSGAEINLCLENIFYRPVIPKNLKFLQQKHAQQQAALAEAKRQQAEMQALAAVKKAAVVSAKKQQQQRPVPRSMPAVSARFTAPPSGAMLQQQPAVHYNTHSKGARLTVANMLNNKQNSLALPTATSPNAAPGGFEVCEICGGYVKDRKALRIHFFYAHRIDLPFNLFERSQAPLYCATCYVRFWTAQGLRKHIDSHKEENQTRGVVGKCISCGHHVLNLLLHMRVVHNRELQHYVGALVCMFCGNHFGSRQECERHITKVHGLVDPVTGTLKSSTNMPVQQQAQKAPSNQKKTTNNSLVKGSVCVLCNLNFGRNVDLTRHCMRMHHTCMKCGMVVIDKASLMKHACLSSSSGTRDCSLCGETGFHPAYYVKHLRDKHLKKFSIRVDKLSSQTIELWTKHSKPGEVLVEISDSDDDVALSHKSSVEATQRKQQKIGPACKTGRSRVNPPAVALEVSTGDKEQDVVHADVQVVDDDDKVADHFTTSEVNSDDDSRSTDSQQERGEKRKLLSGSEEPSKRHKPS